MTSATDPLALMQGYQEAITRAGVRCVLDPQDLNPPAILIRPPSLDYRFGRGRIAASWQARLLLPDAGTMQALRTGFDILQKVHEALASVGVAVLSTAPADFQLADGGIVPGFTLNWNTSQ